MNGDQDQHKVFTRTGTGTGTVKKIQPGPGRDRDHCKNFTGTGTGTRKFLPGPDRDRDRKKVILQFPNTDANSLNPDLNRTLDAFTEYFSYLNLIVALQIRDSFFSYLFESLTSTLWIFLRQS
jgi:hypothetical protein